MTPERLAEIKAAFERWEDDPIPEKFHDSFSDDLRDLLTAYEALAKEPDLREEVANLRYMDERHQEEIAEARAKIDSLFDAYAEEREASRGLAGAVGGLQLEVCVAQNALAKAREALRVVRQGLATHVVAPWVDYLDGVIDEALDAIGKEKP